MDLDDDLATITDWCDNRTDELPDWAIAIISILEAIMSEQDQINADTSAINDGLSAIEAEVAALKAQPAAAQLDLTKLDAVVSRVRGDVAAPAAPAAPPAPAQQPAGTPAQPAQAPAATPAEPAAAATTPVATDVNGAPVQPPAPGDAPAPAKSRYLYSGDTSAINSGEWPKAGTTPDGAQLYTYSGDTAPGDAKGAGGGWTLYAGPVQPQPPAPGEAPVPVQQAPAVNGGIGGATTPPSQSAPPQVPSAPPATQ